MNKHLLLLSSSRVADSPYLQSAVDLLPSFLGETRDVLFVSYAAVTFGLQEYTAKVRAALQSLDLNITGIEEFNDPQEAVMSAASIAVGGGNTFALVSRCQELGLLENIRQRVAGGVPYIGWSAGSNIASPSLATTNDMPVVEPESFKTLGLLPFQINVHYTDLVHPDYHGETRQQRLDEFLVLNPKVGVLALPEGSTLLVENDTATVIGSPGAYWFRADRDKKSLAAGHVLEL